MGQHYLELKMYLEEVEKYPEVTQDKNHRVFPSEQRLYHELTASTRPPTNPVWNRLFEKDGFDDIVLHRVLLP